MIPRWLLAVGREIVLAKEIRGFTDLFLQIAFASSTYIKNITAPYIIARYYLLRNMPSLMIVTNQAKQTGV